MPIYEYRCTACDHLAEVIHGINDPGPRFCESCGAEGTMRKGVGMPAVLYKGSGWARKEGPSRRGPAASSSDGTTQGSAAKNGGEGESSTPPAGSGPAATSGSPDA